MTDRQDDRTAEAPPTRRRRRGWSFWLGLALVLTGLSLLGWVAWQMYGTNIVSQKRHQETVDALHRTWDDPTGATDVETDQGRAAAVLRVPAFGDDYAVPVLQGVADDALASGMGHFEDSAQPGEVGNYALAGHRVTHGEPLRDMPELEAGDELVVETRDAVYTYVLDTGGEELRVPFTADWVLAPVPVNPDGGVGPDPQAERLITLTTCAELFHTDDRLIAFGHLESVEKR
ncbi:class E sortase [Nocardioides sp. 1609]|uniref:class E sortase n=1 Tax=Nocardioides sp. 1609 TaxID=2508327 RepID=UPI001070123B|nr:class E sortase [Nocardioides sp. 1609]